MSEEWRAGEDFADFYAKNSPRLRRALAGWTGDRDLAFDVTQETMMIIMHYWGRYREPEILMYQVARQQLSRYIKKSSNERPVDRVADYIDIASRAASAPAATTDRDMHIDLMRLVADLPDRQRDVVALTLLADLDIASAAKILGISISAVKTHRARALTSLRNAFSSTEHSRGR